MPVYKYGELIQMQYLCHHESHVAIQNQVPRLVSDSNSADLQMRNQKRCAHYVLRVPLPSRTFFIVNTAFNMTSSGHFYSSFHNILNPTVTVLGKIGLEYVDSSGKLSVLCWVQKKR